MFKRKIYSTGKKQKTLVIIFFNGRKESDLKWNAINLKVTQKKQRLNNFYRPK